MKKLLLLFTISLFLYNANAQGVIVNGTVLSKHDSVSLPSARVMLTRLADSVKTTTGTDLQGNFIFSRVIPDQYTIEVSYVGHRTLVKLFRVQDKAINMGNLQLEHEANTIGEVEVIAEVSMGEQLGDTTQFNAAAFKVAEDASVEDLIQKMPGIVVEDGKIQAQGEEVLEVLVDGKRFFGSDAEAALRNLPAEIVQNIQIFDKLSDQAEFSGVDDGNRRKTINVVTKPDRRKGQFGRMSGGYGNDNRYMVGASINAYEGERRFTFTGITNNINLQDYSAGEVPGGGMRGRRGGGNGNMTNHNFAMNYNDKWGEKITVSGDYHFFSRKTVDFRSIFRDFISPDDLGQQYTQTSNNTNRNSDHRMNLRLEYNINETNRLLITPNFSTSANSSFGYRFGRTINDEGPLNQSENENRSENGSFNIGNNIHYSHRFFKKGRVFSTSFYTGISTSGGESYRQQENIFYKNSSKNQNVNQYIRQSGNGYSWRANTSFSEPVGDSAVVQLVYKIGDRKNDSDRRTFDFVELGYDALDTAQSNIFVSQYLTQEFESVYRYNTKKLRLQLGAEYQIARMQNQQEFPFINGMDRSFYSVLPSAQLEYRFTRTKNLRIEYRTNTNAPSLYQLQEVIDISDPFRIRSGNPNLKQTYNNNVSIRFRTFNKETNRVFSFTLNGSLNQNSITNKTLRYDAKTPIVYGDRELSAGQQFIIPVNVNGDMSINSNFNYGQPLGFVPLKVNLNGSLGHNRRPSMLNSMLNFTNSNYFRLGTSLNSNISKEIDFQVSTHSRYNIVKNTLRPQQNNNFFNQTTQVRANITFLKKMVYRTELNHQLNKGLSGGFNNNFLLWNMSLSRKFLEKNKGEVSLSVNDLMGQNNSIRRSVSEQYIQDSQSTVLQRFFMLTVAYNLRNYGGKAPSSKNNRKSNQN
ncbi:TonB-dependent receptor [Botryobacter ruber]|uniref:TonB-dependent receptor n=1 Tax=Botryobacter ruber TaxID=2171629 RepID=UPI000E0B83F7|nr:TonB-dependent receptor [Botryobacter ruber]